MELLPDYTTTTPTTTTRTVADWMNAVKVRHEQAVLAAVAHDPAAVGGNGNFVEHEPFPGIPPTKQGAGMVFEQLREAFSGFRMNVEAIAADWLSQNRALADEWLDAARAAA